MHCKGFSPSAPFKIFTLSSSLCRFSDYSFYSFLVISKNNWQIDKLKNWQKRPNYGNNIISLTPNQHTMSRRRWQWCQYQLLKFSPLVKDITWTLSEWRPCSHLFCRRRCCGEQLVHQALLTLKTLDNWRQQSDNLQTTCFHLTFIGTVLQFHGFNFIIILKFNELAEYDDLGIWECWW